MPSRASAACSPSPSGTRSNKQLFCARDRLGIKPFYYFWDGRLFAFASEIKALLQHPEIRAEFNEQLLPEYLAFGYTSGEETLFTGIRKLMPGHTLTLTCGSNPTLEIKQYWDAPCPTRVRRAPRRASGLPSAARAWKKSSACG